MAVLNEIAAKLQSLSLGTIGSTIHIGVMPETPDACCAVYEYGGLAPDFKIGTSGIYFETPAVQVVFRGVAFDYSTPRSNAATAYNGLASVEVATISSTGGTSALYHWIHPEQAPFLMQRDANNRVYIAFNVLCQKELSA